MTGLLPLFIIGFTYSLYHCIGMCGGFVAAYSASSSIHKSGPPKDRGQVFREQWPLHLLFNLGRIVSYSIIGAVFGYAGSWAVYYGPIAGPHLQGIVSVTGGILMVLFGLSLAGLVRMPSGAMLGGRSVKTVFARLIRSQSPWRTLPMGMLVGTVPCGLVYSMSSYALASGSAAKGALCMAAFGSGTIPAMFCFGFVSSFLSARFRRILLALAVILTVLMGVETIRRGMGAMQA